MIRTSKIQLKLNKRGPHSKIKHTERKRVVTLGLHNMHTYISCHVSTHIILIIYNNMDLCIGGGYIFLTALYHTYFSSFYIIFHSIVSILKVIECINYHAKYDNFKKYDNIWSLSRRSNGGGRILQTYCKNIFPDTVALF